MLRVKSCGKISDPIFSCVKRIVDSGIPWTATVSFQDKRFYSYTPLKSHYLKGKPELHSLNFFLSVCKNAVSSTYIYVCF